MQFGKPIIERQAVAHMLADMAMDVETARLITWNAAWKLEQGVRLRPGGVDGQGLGSEAGTRCASRGMQILGGYSYMVEYGTERALSELAARGYEVYGASDANPTWHEAVFAPLDDRRDGAQRPSGQRRFGKLCRGPAPASIPPST